MIHVSTLTDDDQDKSERDSLSGERSSLALGLPITRGDETRSPSSPRSPPRAFARVGSENRGLYRVIRGESI